MDNLYIDYEQGVILGNKIYEKANHLKELLDNIENIKDKFNNELGDTIDKNISMELLTRIKIMNKLTEVVEATGMFLINVSSAFQEMIDKDDENNRGDQIGE